VPEDDDNKQGTDDDTTAGRESGSDDDKQGESEGKTFTQAEVDAIVQDRVRRAERKAAQETAELRAKAKQLDEREEQEKTDAQKLQDALAKAEKDRDEAVAGARAERLRTQLVTAAVKHGAVDPDDVVRLVDQDAIEFDDSGAPKNADDVVASLLEAKPHLTATAGTGRAGSADQGARGGSGTGQISREALKNMSADEINEARREGKLDNALAGR